MDCKECEIREDIIWNLYEKLEELEEELSFYKKHLFEIPERVEVSE